MKEGWVLLESEITLKNTMDHKSIGKETIFWLETLKISDKKTGFFSLKQNKKCIISLLCWQHG